jgi:hypothetical protein
MKTKVTAAPRSDDLLVDRLQRMIQSEPFQLYQQRIRNELERARVACERVTNSMPEVRAAQGATMALRGVLALPDVLLREMAPRPAQNAAHPHP